jgi:hypothetical protein
VTSTQDGADEWGRLAEASSIVDAIAGEVDDLFLVQGDGLPEWLRRLPLPNGWLLARLDDSTAVPARIAVCGRRSHGSWDGTETISVFGFTDAPRIRTVLRNAACTLRDLDAEDVTTRVLPAPARPGVISVRASGIFVTAGRRVRGQYSIHIAGSPRPGAGRLIAQNVSVDADCSARLADDAVRLNDAVHQAFLATLG